MGEIMRKGLGLGLGPGIRVGMVAGMGIVASGIAVPLSAQLVSAPVFQSLKHDPRWSMHVDFGNGARE